VPKVIALMAGRDLTIVSAAGGNLQAERVHLGCSYQVRFQRKPNGKAL
jgi:hypothetical protein